MDRKNEMEQKNKYAFGGQDAKGYFVLTGGYLKRYVTYEHWVFQRTMAAMNDKKNPKNIIWNPDPKKPIASFYMAEYSKKQNSYNPASTSNEVIKQGVLIKNFNKQKSAVIDADPKAILYEMIALAALGKDVTYIDKNGAVMLSKSIPDLLRSPDEGGAPDDIPEEYRVMAAKDEARVIVDKDGLTNRMLMYYDKPPKDIAYDVLDKNKNTANQQQNAVTSSNIPAASAFVAPSSSAPAGMGQGDEKQEDGWTLEDAKAAAWAVWEASKKSGKEYAGDVKTVNDYIIRTGIGIVASVPEASGKLGQVLGSTGLYIGSVAAVPIKKILSSAGNNEAQASAANSGKNMEEYMPYLPDASLSRPSGQSSLGLSVSDADKKAFNSGKNTNSGGASNAGSGGKVSENGKGDMTLIGDSFDNMKENAHKEIDETQKATASTIAKQ
jgi:hypothetical protein